MKWVIIQSNLPEDIKEQEIFYIKEEIAKDKFAEFVDVKGNVIFPEGVF